MDEVKRRIENIIINGLLVTSNDTGKDVKQIFSTANLETIVGAPLKEYVLEGFTPSNKEWFYSDSGALEMCTKIFEPGDEVYTCLDCLRKDTSIICHDCFQNSEHVNHKRKYWKTDCRVATCDCGNVFAWKQHASCSKHRKMDGSEYVITTDFLNKFSRIILYLCELLEEMCVEDQSGLYTQIEEMIEIYLRDRDSHSKLDINQNQEISGRKAETNVNIRKSCLIIHNNSIDDLDNFTNNLINNYYDKKYHGYNYYYMQSEEIAHVIEAGMSDLKENGYACVLFMSDVEECNRQKQSIEDYLVSEAVPQSLNCRIVSVYRLYFMRLAQILMGVIYEYCFGKTQLCNILSDIVYKRTMLAHNFVINEHLLLKDFRSEMIVRILGIAKYSDTGRIYAAALFLNNIHTLYDHLISDNIRNNKSFLILIDEIVYSPPVVVYLVENGFLCKMIDILSDSLKKIGIKAGIDVVNLYKHKPIQQVLVRVLETSKLLNGLLQISLNDIEVYSKFRMRLLEAGKRLIQFCLDFDNMQPSRKINSKKTERKDYDCLISLYASLVKIFSGMVKWLVYFDVVGRKILELFLKRFQEDIKRISEENSVDNLTSTIIKFCNAETENFSIFNLSHRVFIDLLMGCCVKGTLSGDIKEKIFGDENMLMWISRPAITALLAITNVVTFKSGKQHENLEHLIFVYSKPNISYLYMQDFYAIQILISNLNPDLCLKYMVANIAPSIQKSLDLLKPISSILGSKDLVVSVNIRHLLFFVYNALVERHFIGVSDDPEYHFLERQIIHSLVVSKQTTYILKQAKFMYGKFLKSNNENPAFENIFDEILVKVTSSEKSEDSKDTFCLKFEHSNTVNLFYFMYNFPNCANILEKITPLYQTNKCKFKLPDVVELREIFEGMNTFLFSDTFSDIIKGVLVDCYMNFTKNKTESGDNLLLVSIILCFMLKTSLNQNIHSRFYKTVELIFGINKDLANNSVMTTLAFLKKKLDNCVFSSIVDYLMELSKIPNNVFSYLPENLSDMVNKSKDCRDLALKNLQKTYQETSKYKEESNGDQKDLTEELNSCDKETTE